MRHTLFLPFFENVYAHDSYFLQKWDALGNIGLNSIQKCIVALHILFYGITLGVVDEYCQMGESMAMEAIKCFVKVVKETFETKNLK